jgi:hypothetical protein
LQLNKTDDFFRHAFLLAGINALIEPLVAATLAPRN